jgi:protocatechuate 3,4-dioxygenase beta subunit
MLASDVLLICTVCAFANLPVSGVVSDTDGKPAEGANVFLAPSVDDITPPVRATTGPNGEFRFDDISEKQISSRTRTRQIVVYKAGVGIAAQYMDAARPGKLALKLEPTAPIRIQVFDPQGSPIADASVRLANFTPVSSRSIILTKPIPDPHFQARTNAQGEAVLESLPANSRFVVHVQTEAYGVQAQSFSETAKMHAVRLRPVGKLRGKLKTEGDEDLAGAVFDVMSVAPIADNGGHGTTGLAEVRTNGRGEFEIPALAIGEVRILNARGTRNSRLFLSEEVKTSLATGKLKEIELPTIRGIRIWGTFVEEGEDAQPVAGIVIDLQVSFASDPGRRLDLTTVTDATGTFESVIPPGGTLFFTIREIPAPFLKPQTNPRPIAINAEAGEVKVGMTPVARGVSLSGIVIDEMKRPVAGAKVSARWWVRSGAPGLGQITSYVQETAETNAQGEFTFAAVTNSPEITLTAEGPTRGSMEPMTIDPSDPKNREMIRLAIEPAGMITVEGRVVDAKGVPVAGAELRIYHVPAQLAGRQRRAKPVLVRFKDFAKIISDADGRFVTPHALSRLAEYSVQVVARKYEPASVEVPMPDKSASRVTVPDIIVAPAK